ncbi:MULTISPECIES: sodium-dependent transporter [Micrococcaceae]|uniref:sodium-dependent transporter n=1 Tax=Micrococcaceae TaxID=1268 RepID=UPI00161B0B35|nr:sodium-dependent transporter [Citricoccus sp.]MBB5749798.1 NSS family neurotransmitter:Na+ symporter [Micrococcus sp. TA1]HRO29318.1 sodium-dependent transporter [Citricoccus sp.]HRO92649.1 sodium-dependent transporter [Citricoccus sp.]
MSSTTASPQKASREQFAGRWAFIFAAIGSAVGLGNIWRFPYVAYENGGGAFIVPYLVALLTAGIPLLFFDYAIGHRFKGSPPLAFRRLSRWTESIGWWQVLICFVIGVYYAAIIAYAAMYTWFSFDERWGDDPEAFFFGEYLRVADDVAPNLEFVPSVFWPMLVVWLILLVILGVGVKKGIAMASLIGIPVLVVMFVILVVVALFLPGAPEGLNALFTPNWEVLTNPQVWIAAYGQIFFSLSVGFGIMITYASYLKRRTNLTGSGLMVGFSNSSFEILAGIGVFAALGFMAQANGVEVAEVVTNGIGLAFIAFPTIISEAPAGALIGVLFFASLVVAGFTSLISILEVVVSAVKDKLGWSRWTTVIVVVGTSGLISLLLFSTTSGINVLDVTDAFANNFGIVGAALVAVVVVSWLLRRLDNMVNHLNAVSSFRVGRAYKVLVAVILPIVLAYMWVSDVVLKATEGYGDLPSWFVGTFGWGMSIALIVVAVLLSLLPWTQRSALHSELNDNLESEDLPEYPEHEGTGPGVQWDTVGQHHHAEHPRKGH